MKFLKFPAVLAVASCFFINSIANATAKEERELPVVKPVASKQEVKADSQKVVVKSEAPAQNKKEVSKKESTVSKQKPPTKNKKELPKVEAPAQNKK